MLLLFLLFPLSASEATMTVQSSLFLYVSYKKNQEIKKVIGREEQPYRDQNVETLVKTIEQIVDVTEWVGNPQESEEMQKH